MKRRMIRATVVIAVLLVGVMGVTGLMGAMSASAEAGDNDDLEFTYLVSPGRALIGPVDPADPLFCDQTAANAFDVCPDLATASNGETIEMKGSGTLSIDADDGEPDDVDGGGGFVHKIGGDSFSGTWEAKQLLMFETYGPAGEDFIAVDPAVREAWRTGRALILVHLVYDDTGMEADAILELGCRLPGNPDIIPGTIEGIRLLVGGGGLNFNLEADPRATLFIDITEEDDD